MDNAKYIQLVKTAIKSSQDRAECITEISRLSIPDDAAPLIVLIRGDSQQLKSAVSYAKDHDPASLTADQINLISAEMCDVIVQKLQKYLSDWDAGDTYRYQFNIKATYGAFTNEHGDIEYIDIRKKGTTVKTVSQAIEAAKEWQSRLLEKVMLYSDQKTGHKLISVKPTYTIRNRDSQKIAAGTLEGDDEFGISTWLNQD